MKTTVRFILAVTILMALDLSSSVAATMNDYCVVPPFIQEIAKPNLLMVIDNSASMSDLAYDDAGLKHCSNSSTVCVRDADCSSGGTCTVFSREPKYCYDDTYFSTRTYVGYFNRLQSDGSSTQYYQYDFTNDIFNPVNSYSCVPGSGETAKQITSPTNQLCLIYNSSLSTGNQVTKLLATGNYLNWLTASKFDAEKQVLTGGKHVTNLCSNDATRSCSSNTDCVSGGTCSAVSAPFLMAESRGCVGQEYIKDAMTGDFVNFATGDIDTNTSLGITFTVTGPRNEFNALAPSPGGQTYFNIFAGASGTAYNYLACQEAIKAISTGGNAEIKKWVDLCLATSNKPGTCQMKPTMPCSTGADCALDLTKLLTAKVCTGDTSLSCATDANCVLAAGSYCSGKPSLTCTGDASCTPTIPTVNGTCTDITLMYIKAGVYPQNKNKITTAGLSCSSDAACSFDGFIAQPGACTGLVPSSTANYGTCIAQAGGNFGTCVSNNVGPCVVQPNDAAVKTKVVFQQAMQECWSIRPSASQSAPKYGFSNMNTVKQQCPDIYASYKACSNNTLRQCTSDNDCGSGNTCLEGPAAIGPGNPALLCGNAYAGACFYKSGTQWLEKPTCEDFPPDPANSLANQEWRFCRDVALTTPVVVDPSNPPSDTTVADNLPPILSGISVVAQLGLPLRSNIAVRVSTPTAPSGIVQDYASKIRMGVMSFNTFGSSTESGTIGAQKVCSNDNRIVCTSTTDCGGSACNASSDQDGAKMLHYVGQGTCSITTSTKCSKAAQCPTGERCVSAGVGDHTAGLINEIDKIRASTWTPFAEAFYNAIGYYAKDSTDTTGKSSRTALRLNTSDFESGMNPSEYVCQANNVILVTDGSSTADQNSTKTGVVDVYKSASGNVTGTCPKYAGSQDFDDLVWLGRHRDINTLSTSTATTTLPVKKNESITTFVVFNGTDNGEAGDCNNTAMLTKAAANGGTNLLRTDIPEQYEETLRSAFAQVAGGTASGTAASILSNSEGSGANILQAVFYPTKQFESETVSGQSVATSASWIGEMQNLWYYVDPYIGNSTVRENTADAASALDLNVINDYVTEFQFKGGETIAVLKQDSNGDGSGDTVVTTAMDARVTSQGYCTNTTTPASSTYAKCVSDAGCSGETCIVQGIVNADDIRSLWRAGKQLWNRDLSSSPRTLYTYLYGTTVATPAVPAVCGTSPLTFSSNGMIDLVALQYKDSSNTWQALPAADKCVIVTLLQATTIVETGNILKFIQGYDHADYDASAAAITGTIDGNKPRSRSVKIGGTKKVWKLGDIISSTPRIQSFNKLNNFHLDSPAGYGDMTYADDTTGTGFANSTAYKARGMAYAGANDGMLHAFKLGSLNITASGNEKATLTGTGLGEEQWAFIPKNVLPYLKYLADPAYSHLYLVDGPTRLIDASIGYNDNTYINNDLPASLRTKYSAAGCDATGGTGIHTAYWACKRDPATSSNKSWRSLIIGSMGIGGASAEYGATCTNCVKNPIAGAGRSSYYAIDITDPANPQYLWEFSDTDLGYATTGAAVARISHKFTSSGVTYKDTNGRWFAVIGNGPTGPIDTTYHQFKGKSDNPLRVFVLDLKNGTLLKKFDTTINNAFAGSITSAPIDTDRAKKLSDGFYSDDALYFGYSACTANCGTDTPTWNGGIMRLLTDENINPDNWSLSTLISNIGPVSTAIGKLQDRKNKKLWLYTGSGRYFFKGDDSSNTSKIIGIKEPCYSPVKDDIFTISEINGQSPMCTTEITYAASDFADQSTAINSMVDNLGVSKKGWFINLDVEDTVGSFGAERIITEPVAMPNGAVFFTSFMPSADICNYGGKSFLWGARYDTGGTLSAGQLKGKALVQVSTGAFEEVNLATALTDDLGRKMGTPMIGKPPTDPPPIVSASGNKPLKRILHIQEK